MSKAQPPDCRDFIGGQSFLSHLETQRRPIPRQFSGCEFHMSGGHFWWQAWHDRDDIAPGFRIGVVRQLG